MTLLAWVASLWIFNNLVSWIHMNVRFRERLHNIHWYLIEHDSQCIHNNIGCRVFTRTSFFILTFLYILLYFQFHTWSKIVMPDSFLNFCYVFMISEAWFSWSVILRDYFIPIGYFGYSYTVVAYDLSAGVK